MNFFNKKEQTQVGETPMQEAEQAQNPAEFIQQNAIPKQKRDARILNTTQLQRTKDAKRLAESKLQGLEESLRLLQAQQQWLRRYQETVFALEREKKRLFELGKQKAVMAKDASMLERYDMFEGIHGIYQKLAVVREQIGYDKRGLSLLEREAELNHRHLSDQEKLQQQAKDQLNTSATALLDAFDNIFQAFQLAGANEAIDAETDFLSGQNYKLKEETEVLASMIAETERNIESLQSELENLSAKRQSIEMHENMIRHGESVLLQLKTLQEVYKQNEELQQKSQQAVRRQNEENEMLSRVFARYQDVVSQAETAEGELSMHRSRILGQNGLMLQERALMLKGRRQMLFSALSLWKRISSGYENIEERKRRVTDLRLRIRHLEDNVRQLETEVGKTQRLSEEKKYTYLLSKGQDIIQLRSDLREGVSCSVCGATHHPYHSDTILDQSKLIGQMKTDYELLFTELQSKQQQLLELQTELATAKGALTAEEEILNTIRISQDEDVQEWKLYAELAPTFAECSESTNLDARTAMLRQFIENVSRDAELAEKELNTFTFHQSSIAQLGEELQKLEQRKSEINVRLGELNTGCQVLSREVEQMGLLLESSNKRYTGLYESLQHAVTIKDWYTVWQKAPEQLYEQIQRLITDWSTLEAEITEKETLLNRETTKLDGMKKHQKSFLRATGIITEQTGALQVRKAENQKVYNQIIQDRDAKTLYLRLLEQLKKAQEQFEKERIETDSIRHDTDIMQGRHDYYLAHIGKLEGEQKELGEKLDLWMHGFNLQHPPVQASELDEVFADGKDWGQIRSTVKQINADMLLCQAKVEDLNSRIIAMETEDGHCSTTTPDIQESIAAKQEALTKQRSETMMLIARLAVQLEDHEKALAAERNSAEMQTPPVQPETNLA